MWMIATCLILFSLPVAAAYYNCHFWNLMWRFCLWIMFIIYWWLNETWSVIVLAMLLFCDKLDHKLNVTCLNASAQSSMGLKVARRWKGIGPSATRNSPLQKNPTPSWCLLKAAVCWCSPTATALTGVTDKLLPSCVACRRGNVLCKVRGNLPVCHDELLWNYHLFFFTLVLNENEIISSIIALDKNELSLLLMTPCQTVHGFSSGVLSTRGWGQK